MATDRKALREELREVLSKYLVEHPNNPSEVVAAYFSNVVVALNNQQAPSSIPVPEKVATTS